MFGAAQTKIGPSYFVRALVGRARPSKILFGQRNLQTPLGMHVNVKKELIFVKI